MKTFRNTVSALALVSILGACAGRDAVAPTPIAQPQDASQSCDALSAEMYAQQVRVTALRAEESNKRGQNIAMGVVGAVIFWPALFAMDFKDAAGTDRKNVEARLQYLTALAAQKACAPPPTPVVVPAPEPAAAQPEMHQPAGTR